MRRTKPVAKLVPIVEPQAGRRTLAGSYRGKISWTEGALDPMTDEELIESGFECMLDGPLVAPPAEPEK